MQRPSYCNVPNAITVSRLILAFVLFWMIDRGGSWLTAAVIFLIAAATDALDGFIARRYGLVTVLGRVLDPFVDKIIVCGAFIFLLARPDSGVNAWMVLVVVAREMFITSLRSFLESQGWDFSAAWSGKLKMVFQCAAVLLSLLSLSEEWMQRVPAPELFKNLRDATLWMSVALTIGSGLSYVQRAWQLMRR